MKKFFALATAALLVAVGQSASAQESSAPGVAFYVELGGPGVIMSANLDGRFIPKSRLGIGGRIGAGFGYQAVKKDEFTGERISGGQYYTIPIGLNYIFGKSSSSSAFEVGGGISYLTRKMSLYNYNGNEKKGNVIGFISLMYRVVPEDGGFSFRIGFTPIIGTAGDLFPMGGISFGYAL